MQATMSRLSDAATLEVRHRSATLGVDPKNQELRHFVGSHRHEARLREAAGLTEKLSDRDFAAKIVLDVTAKEDKLDRYDPMQSCKARLEWREEMDRSVRQLMQDQDLMLDDRMQESTKHALRCQHLDKTYDWFQRHGKKEASKEKAHPSYLRYDANAPVMPGSTRRDPSGGAGGWVPQAKATATKMHSTGASIMAAAAQTMNRTKSLPDGLSPKKGGLSRHGDANWKPRF